MKAVQHLHMASESGQMCKRAATVGLYAQNARLQVVKTLQSIHVAMDCDKMRGGIASIVLFTEDSRHQLMEAAQRTGMTVRLLELYPEAALVSYRRMRRIHQ
jgi:hypothetical protein